MTIIRVLSLVALLSAMASTGCEGGASGRCDAIYSKLEQMPEFKQAGFARYGNELRAAFVEGCGKLKDEDLKCLESVKSAADVGNCSGGGEAMSSALDKVGQPK